MKLIVCLALAAAIEAASGDAVSSKMDFGEPPPIYFAEEPTFAVTNSSAVKTEADPEDVEVEQRIVVTTKLKNNNNKRGFTSNGDPDGSLTYNIGQTKNRNNKNDDGEIPVIKSYASVDTTEIKTPDTRYKTKIYPDSIFVNRNIRDEADVFPNVVVYPLNWKPASFYNNINYRDQNGGWDPYSMSRRRPNQSNVQRKISEEGQREFYCKKCEELSRSQGFRGCGMQQRSANRPNFRPIVPNDHNQNAGNVWHETTTQKMKIDGKLAKLN